MNSRFLLSAVILFCLFCCGCGQEKKALAVGDMAPDFTVTALDGESLTLSKWQGAPVVLRFWSTECKYCRADTPIFNHYFTSYKDKGLRVVYINTGNESLDVVRTFVADLDIDFPVVVQGGDMVGAKYNVKIVPQTIFVDPDGKIMTAILGGVGEAEFKEILGEYL